MIQVHCTACAFCASVNAITPIKVCTCYVMIKKKTVKKCIVCHKRTRVAHDPIFFSFKKKGECGQDYKMTFFVFSLGLHGNVESQLKKKMTTQGYVRDPVSSKQRFKEGSRGVCRGRSYTLVWWFAPRARYPRICRLVGVLEGTSNACVASAEDVLLRLFSTRLALTSSSLALRVFQGYDRFVRKVLYRVA